MENIIDEDFISCPICLEVYYSYENKLPLCIECGHTLCKKCLESLSIGDKLECPFDKRFINLSQSNHSKVENLIIKTTISIIKSLQINVKSLTKLSMVYCHTCDMFISNYVKEIHYTVNHKIQSVNEYTLKWFDYISNNINGKVISSVLRMYFLAYFYQSDNFKLIKQFKIIQIVNINKRMFTFYGENYIMTEKTKRMFKILKCILSNNDLRYDNFSIKRGIIIGINSQIMQGYFLFSSENPNISVRGFGILNYLDVSFFGLVSLIPDPDHSGFAFDFGVIRDNHTLLYGIFNHNFNEYPFYHLSYGEEITLTIKGVHVIRTKYINESNEESSVPFVEIPSNNQFFLYTNNNLRFQPPISHIASCKIQFEFNTPCTFTKDLNKISFIIENSDNEIIKKLSIRLKYFESLSDYDYLEKSILDCYLILNSVTVVFFFIEEKNNNNIIKPLEEKDENNEMNIINTNISIIISDGFDYDIKKNFHGYKISPKGEEINKLFIDLAKYKIKDILSQGNDLINLIEELLTSQLTDSVIEYQLFNHSTLLRVVNADYLSINCEKGVIKCHYRITLKKNTVFYNDEIKTMMVLDLLPNFFSSVLLKKVSSKIKLIEEVSSEKVRCYTCCILI